MQYENEFDHHFKQGALLDGDMRCIEFTNVNGMNIMYDRQKVATIIKDKIH